MSLTSKRGILRFARPWGASLRSAQAWTAFASSDVAPWTVAPLYNRYARAGALASLPSPGGSASVYSSVSIASEYQLQTTLRVILVPERHSGFASRIQALCIHTCVEYSTVPNSQFFPLYHTSQGSTLLASLRCVPPLTWRGI